MKRTLLLAGLAAAAMPVLAGGYEVRRVDGKPQDTIYRDLSFEVRAENVNEETREVELSFSSEEPYERWWGTEILDHGANALRLGRLNSGAALLVNHDVDDQVGVVVKAWVGADRKGRAVVRFGRSARAEEVYQDVKDGVRRLVSVGYRIHELILEARNGEAETYRITDWEPYEISLVAVPADATVGVDRADAPPPFDPRSILQQEDDDMLRGSIARRDGGDSAPPPAAVVPPGSAALSDQARAEERAAERARIGSIDALAARLAHVNGIRELAATARNEGHSLERFLALVEERAPASAIRRAESPLIGMSDNDNRRYSFVRLLNAVANPNDRRAQEEAAFELECSSEARERRGGSTRELRGYTVPVDVLRASILGEGHARDLTVGTATAGGHTVATDLLSGSFIELLRNRMAVLGLGATMLTDLNGNIAIPRATGGATAYWLAESGAPTESQPAFDQVALTPKTVGAYTDISRKLLIQSSIDVEAFVRGDLATTLALAIDAAGVNGSGASNQPTGVINTAGIGSVPGGTNGAAPTWDHIVDLETQVSIANADVGTMAYLTNAKVRGKLKKTQQFASTNGAPVWASDNQLNGYTARASNQVPSNLTKGTAAGICSAIIFGNWADLLIGMWGGLDLTVDPFTNSTSGTVRVVALQDVDVAVRRAASFAAMLDALTA